jgi:recombination protein RecR
VEGRGPEHLDLERLTNRAGGGDVQEVILALAPTAEGDGTALVVAERLKGMNVRITRLARGLPTGATLDYVNPGMLADALRGRQALDEPGS